MSFRYRIIESQKLVIVSAEKAPTIDEQLEHFDALGNDPKYIAPMKKLVNFSKTAPIRLNQDEIEMLAEKKKQYKEKFKDEKVAVVVSNDLDFGISRMVHAKMSFHGYRMNVFRSLADAIKWLDIDLDDTDLIF